MVSTTRLRLRLRDALGADTLLYRHFDRALRRQDEQMINRTIESLSLYPAETRQQVEEVLLGWVFETGIDDEVDGGVHDRLS